MTKSVQKKVNLPAAPSLRTARRNISLAEKSNETRRQGRKFKLSELPHLRIEVARDPSEDPMNVGPKSVFGHYDYDYGIV